MTLDENQPRGQSEFETLYPTTDHNQVLNQLKAELGIPLFSASHSTITRETSTTTTQ